MSEHFWKEYIDNSINTIKVGSYLGILILLYTVYPDVINAKREYLLTVVILRLFSVLYLIAFMLYVKYNKDFLSKTSNYYFFIYSIFTVILFTALGIGYINSQLTTFYFFAVIELELFYSTIVLSGIRIFSFFIVFANLLYFTLVFISDEPINNTVLSVFSSFIPIAPLSIYIQYVRFRHHKSEYFKRIKLSIEINKKEHAQIRLLEAKEIAEKANNAKSLFIANLSHEIKTPIHAISNYSRMGINKIDKIDREKILHYFKQIEISSKRLLGLVNDLLDFTKFENRTDNCNCQINNLLSTVKKAVLELKILADKKGIEIKIKNDEVKNIAYYDESKIMRVVLNILSNAINFTPEKGKITISLIHKDDDFLMVRIADDGIGVDKSELRTIFNDFTQGSKTSKENSGTGLGLSISKRIIINHGGDIWAVNNENGGLTVSFTLPKNKEVLNYRGKNGQKDI